MKILAKEIKLMGLTHEDAAKKIGVSRTALSKWITGAYVPGPLSVPAMKKLGFSDTAILNPTKEVEV